MYNKRVVNDSAGDRFGNNPNRGMYPVTATGSRVKQLPANCIRSFTDSCARKKNVTSPAAERIYNLDRLIRPIIQRGF